MYWEFELAAQVREWAVLDRKLAAQSREVEGAKAAR